MLLLLERRWPRYPVLRIPKLGLLVLHYIIEVSRALEGVGLNQIPKAARIVHVRVLDPHEELLMGEAVEVVVELSIVLVEVHIELRLEEQLTRVDVVDS